VECLPGSVSVHARNLHLFLTNDEDSRNYRAAHYNDRFKASKSPVEIKNKIAVYIVHPGKARTEEGDEKFNLDRADRAFEWIESEFTRFLEKLPQGDRAHWNPELADPSNYNPDQERDVPAACTHPIAVTLNVTNQTHTSHIFTWEFPKTK
jgi:hypothetical protein